MNLKYVLTLRVRSGNIVEMLERRSVGICFVQETRFRRKSVRLISQKAAEHKLFWIENVESRRNGNFLGQEMYR